jgi:hypothetical protein
MSKSPPWRKGIDAKHLWKYLGEFEYRYNMRHVPHLMLDRLMVSFAR